MRAVDTLSFIGRKYVATVTAYYAGIPPRDRVTQCTHFDRRSVGPSGLVTLERKVVESSGLVEIFLPRVVQRNFEVRKSKLKLGLEMLIAD